MAVRERKRGGEVREREVDTRHTNPTLVPVLLCFATTRDGPNVRL